VVVVASGLGAAYLLTRGEDDGEQAADPTTSSIAQDPAETGATDSGDPSSSPSSEPAGADTGQAPAVSFDEAALGPITAGTPYTIGVAYGPADAQYQLSIDGVPQGEPMAELAPVTFEPGRHLLEISVITPAGTTIIEPALVYAVGQVPAEPIWAANLSSVSKTDPTEGWAEAVSRFETYSLDHPDLKLLPSESYPSLTAGYWILYVDGFAGADEATAYCEAHQLAVPDECFPRRLDPAAPAGG
jgi:hypothetical protein